MATELVGAMPFSARFVEFQVSQLGRRAVLSAAQVSQQSQPGGGHGESAPPVEARLSTAHGP
jgi:hypothetical protein